MTPPSSRKTGSGNPSISVLQRRDAAWRPSAPVISSALLRFPQRGANRLPDALFADDLAAAVGRAEGADGLKGLVPPNPTMCPPNSSILVEFGGLIAVKHQCRYARNQPENVPIERDE